MLLKGTTILKIPLLALSLSVLREAICANSDKSLEELQESLYEYLLKENPEYASRIGDKRYDDQVDDFSLEVFDRWKVKVGEFLKDLRSISKESLSDDHKTDYDIFETYMNTYLDGYKWRLYSALSPVMLMSSPSSMSSWVVDRLTLSDKQDFDNFIKRIQKYPMQISQIKRRMQKAIELNTTLHKVSVEGVPAMLDKLTGDTPEDCFLYKPFLTVLDNITSISDNDKATLRRQAKTAIESYVGAVIDFKAFITNVYLENTRAGVGVNSWNNGENFYKESIIHRLSVNLTAEEIYNIGIKEVQRISGEMKKIFEKMDIRGTIKESFDVLKNDTQYYLESGEAMVNRYSDIIHKEIEPKLSSLFKDRPDIPVVVKATPNDGVFASYSSPPGDGSRPGIFNLNAFHPDQSPWYSFTAIAMHEANPGHHLQITTAITSDIPQIRRDRFTNLYFQIPTAFPTWNAYIEGWGLYAEYLGEEMGLYRTDVDMLGRYSLEIFRACRLVVDTGLHHFNWTRNRAMEYLSNYTSLGENDISFEVNRYISIPGQALAYKIGEIKFKELRKKAEDMLGKHFDIRDFHRTVLRNGPMSFSNLEKVLDLWIKKVKATTSRASSSSSSFCVFLVPVLVVTLKQLH